MVVNDVCESISKKKIGVSAGCNGVEEREQMLDPGILFDVSHPSIPIILSRLMFWEFGIFFTDGAFMTWVGQGRS